MHKWSKACDQYNEPLEPAWAALMISRAAWYAANNDRAGMHPKWDVEKAGSVIRAWRKSLPDQGERIADIDIGDDRLLWAALQGVCFAEAAVCHADGEVAKHLRFTEAFLRSWWKRQQGLKETL